MDKKIKEKINQKVYRNFPSLSGSKPKVQSQKNKTGSNVYTFIYKGSAISANKKTIPLIVRVVCTNDGKIIKMSTAR